MNSMDSFLLTPDFFDAYGIQRNGYQAAYRTTNTDYGWMPPNAHTVPNR